MTTITSTTSLSSPALLLTESPMMMTMTTSSTASTAVAATVGSKKNVVSQVIVHPLVLLHVLDHHTRRPDASGRVIGTLLGRRDGKKVRRRRHRHCPLVVF
jgi:hypothetical protein